MISKIARPVAIGLFVFGLSGMQAAPQQRDADDSWYQSRESFYHDQGWKMRMFDRIREDLDRVQTRTFSGGGDEYRITRTKEELNDLQSKLASGGYDEPELDAVTGALGKVVADNRLAPRDRDILNDDLSRLRDYREHHTAWK